MKNKKTTVWIAILVVVVIAASIPWLLILVGNMRRDGAHEPTAVAETHITEVPQATIATSAPTPTPAPTPTATPTPTPTPTPAPTPEPPPEEKIIDISETYPELSAELDRLSSRYNCVAVSLVAYDGDSREFYAYQHGLAHRGDERQVDIDTKFRVASLAKLTTVICAMVLVDEGLLDLDEDISTYLGYKVRNPNFPNTPITSRMLMQHRSSIFDSETFERSRGGNSSMSVKSLLDAGSSFRGRQPGSAFEYSNFGISVLAAACEKIYGEVFDIFAREVLFAPLGIDAAYVPSRLDDTDNIAALYNANHSLARSVQAQLDVGDSRNSGELGHDQHLAQGNLTISAIDYARILAMLGNGGSLNGVRIISPEAVAAINDANESGRGFSQGLATRLSDVPYMPGGEAYWHTGSNYGIFAQYVYSADGSNTGFVVVTTGAEGDRSEGMLTLANDMFAHVQEGLQ